MFEINVNDGVLVKLTPAGEERYRRHYEELNETLKARGIMYRAGLALTKDDQGRSRFQLWELMNIFGDMMCMAAVDLPFERNAIFVDPIKWTPPRDQLNRIVRKIRVE